ncbi:MAG: glycine zipper domain-containing protein [Rhodomicrobium sp.]
MRKLGPFLLALALAAIAAGCETKEQTGTLFGASTGALIGSTLGRGPGGHFAGMVGGALVGGFIGNRIGAAMDAEDRRRAAEAQYYAFENGQRADWRNPNGHYGYIEPQPVYYYHDMRCREFSQTVIINGRPETMIGKVCRGPDGVWREA